MRAAFLLLSTLLLPLNPTDSAPEQPSSASPGAPCNVSLVRAQANPSVVGTNTSDNNLTWFITNNGSATLTFTGSYSLHSSGDVVAVHRTHAVGTSLAVGAQVDADMAFDVAGAGSGTASLWLGSSCGYAEAP